MQLHVFPVTNETKCLFLTQLKKGKPLVLEGFPFFNFNGLIKMVLSDFTS